MDLTVWAFIFLAVSITLLVAEVFLPSHGLLGLFGTIALICMIVVCFRINQYLGLGVMLASLVAAPFAFSFAMKIWPRTPVGRRLMLQPTQSMIEPPKFPVGTIGTAMSELRPMGTCDFNGERVEVRSQLGMIPAGTIVAVVQIDAGRLIVRPA